MPQTRARKPTKAERIKQIKRALARPDLPTGTYWSLRLQLDDLGVKY